MVFVIALTGALVGRAALAEEWVSIVKDFKGFDEHAYEVLLDLSSVRASADQPRIRTAKLKYARIGLSVDEEPANELMYSITTKSFECDAKRIRLDAVEVGFRDGTVQDVDPGGDENSWHAVDDASAKKLINAVCSYKKPKSLGSAPTTAQPSSAGWNSQQAARASR
jgi:hypothetical protein